MFICNARINSFQTNVSFPYPHDLSDLQIMQRLLCPYIFPNDIQRIFRWLFLGLIAAHTPLKTAKIEF